MAALFAAHYILIECIVVWLQMLSFGDAMVAVFVVAVAPVTTWAAPGAPLQPHQMVINFACRARTLPAPRAYTYMTHDGAHYVVRCSIFVCLFVCLPIKVKK